MEDPAMVDFDAMKFDFAPEMRVDYALLQKQLDALIRCNTSEGDRGLLVALENLLSMILDQKPFSTSQDD